jgi:hypothetical protein
MGWEIASIALGLIILLSVSRIVGWMAAADDEPVVQDSFRFLPTWMTPKHVRRFRATWVVIVGVVLVGMGVYALL